MSDLMPSHVRPFEVVAAGTTAYMQELLRLHDYAEGSVARTLIEAQALRRRHQISDAEFEYLQQRYLSNVGMELYQAGGRMWAVVDPRRQLASGR